MVVLRTYISPPLLPFARCGIFVTACSRLGEKKVSCAFCWGLFVSWRHGTCFFKSFRALSGRGDAMAS